MQADRAARLAAFAAAAWLLLWIAAGLAAPPGVSPDTLFALAPLLVCAVMSWRATALFAVAAALLVVLSGWWNGLWSGAQQWIRLLDVVLVGAAAVGIAYVRVRREQQLARVTKIAEAAQRAILPSLPATTDGLHMATRYLSAAEDAVVGGDLYDCCLEGYTRVLVGDVRGKGLAAVEQAARVIRAFRQAAAAKPHLADVATSMHTYLEPFFGAEEFATALLVECSANTITLTSAGHPPAILIRSGGAVTFVDVPAGLPLGIGDDFDTTTVAWSPGDRLLLYTDGLSEARNADGEFLPLLEVCAPLGSGTIEDALTGLLEEVRRHVPHGDLGDDLAVVMLEHAPTAAAVADPHSLHEPAGGAASRPLFVAPQQAGAQVTAPRSDRSRLSVKS
jgi:sigma-B regulation protein RsbU (phosphoserine phosphatase)